MGAVLSTRNRGAFAPGVFARTHVLERIPWPKHGSTPHSRSVALAEVRAAHYDVALIPSEEIEAYAFARDARIGRRIGFVNGWEKPFKTLAVRHLLSKALVRPASARRAAEHEVETVFRLGAELHAEDAPTREVARLFPLVLDDPEPAHGRIVLQLSRKLARHGLDAAAFVLLARELRARFEDVVALGDDPALAEHVRREGRIDVELPENAAWKRMIAGARALVAPDSGAVHVAGMTGVPSLVLLAAAPSAERDAARWRPWAAPSMALVLERTWGPALARRAASELEGLLVGSAVG
ncbi:MAG TPA: hypothetical protein VKG44_01415 [Candidatus Baltobacteraceae bacterium]|nr:hypothetical protein [Candidatus Baltobacteraceae bacterium]